MGEMCLNCVHFDQDTTELPVCSKHHRFTHAEWTCNDFAHVFQPSDARYESEPSEDDREVR